MFCYLVAECNLMLTALFAYFGHAKSPLLFAAPRLYVVLFFFLVSFCEWCAGNNLILFSIFPCIDMFFRLNFFLGQMTVETVGSQYEDCEDPQIGVEYGTDTGNYVWSASHVQPTL
jgi:hypothetical protein